MVHLNCPKKETFPVTLTIQIPCFQRPHPRPITNYKGPPQISQHNERKSCHHDHQNDKFPPMLSAKSHLACSKDHPHPRSTINFQLPRSITKQLLN